MLRLFADNRERYDKAARDMKRPIEDEMVRILKEDGARFLKRENGKDS
jgi:hypothetical protein